MSASRSLNNNPSIAQDPASLGTLIGALKFFFKKSLQNTDGMLPAQVIAYDRDARRVQVQLLITMVTTEGIQVPRQQIASIPVLTLGGGGWVIDFPLKPGDLGWIFANDRDISLFLQNYENSPPNTGRMKTFSDGLFVPSQMTGYTVDGGDADNMVIQNLDGTVKIAMTPAGVKITGNAIVEGEILANGGITITGGATPINVTGNLLLTGNIGVIGNITATGTISPMTPP